LSLTKQPNNQTTNEIKMKAIRFTSLASLMLLLLAGSAQAQIAWTNLSIYFRADNVDGAGNSRSWS
jgi:hypothetical protein